MNMIKNSSISRCLKSDFKVFEKINEKSFIIRWGKEDEVEKVYEVDETTGERKFTGETKKTDWCSYESGLYEGLLSVDNFKQLFNKRNRIPSMAEMKVIGDAFGVSEKQMIPWMKEQLKRAIKKHDKSRGSDGVENFSINGINLWLDKDTRTGLLLRFQAEKASGKNDTILWHEGMAFPLLIESGIQMLYAIEVYASATYDLKEQLLAEADNLDSVAGMISFDETRKNGYPAQLAF